MKYIIRLFFTLSFCALLVLLVACNTTKGVGKDIKKAGEGLEGSADRNGAE